MPTRVTFDFSRPATLSQIVPFGSSAAFDAVTEMGRAAAIVGPDDASTALIAGSLGDWANGIRYTVKPRTGPTGSVQYDYQGGEVRLHPAGTDTARAAVLHFLRDPNDPRVAVNDQGSLDRFTNMRAGREPWVFRAVVGPGDGTDPVAAGSTLLAGGLAPVVYRGNFAQFDVNNDTDNGGLFVFDASEPLQLMQFGAYLSASVSWALTLRPVLEDDYMIPLASGTGQFVRVDLPAVILPGWGVSFEALAQGKTFCTVKRA